MNINISNASDTLRKIISDRRGFRNDNFQDNKVVSLKDIVKYEYNELGNNDIIDTINNLYGYKIDTTKNVINEILKYITESLNSDVSELKALWVTTYESVEKLYKLNNDDPITVFRFEDKDWMVISDLDEEGILIAYK